MTSGRTSPALSNSSASCAMSPSSSSSSGTPPPPQSPSAESNSTPSPNMTPEKSSLRGRKPHRMASNFELSDEQPENLPTRRSRMKGDSFEALFGTPVGGKLLPHRRSVSAAPVPTSQRRSRKPMPINPLTGEALGSRTGLDLEVPLAPAPAKVLPNFSRFKRPPPGGFASHSSGNL
eukprot:TRINITY_DN1128_c0_g1_i9.p1 TRINITY_DN1128_c0_g1~~TRINITY_DN1128_c0_g1_i9.p1  ORF type:complete len:208 (-),score=47.14 TRINITY_DN1128_c0_g1_i9:421-951(-)